MASPAWPWLFPYQEDGGRLGDVVMRPIVPAALVGEEVSAPSLALVDSGCSHILAAPWLADSAGVDSKASGRNISLGIGGRTVHVDFADIRVRLMAPTNSDEDYVEWEAEVGFVDHWRQPFQLLLGQRGFFDQFTVTTSLFSKLTAVEPYSMFDERFGVPSAPPSSERSSRARRSW